MKKIVFFILATVRILTCVSLAHAWDTSSEISYRSVSLGFDHSAAIGEDGSLWTWGNNSSGQLGDGTKEDKNIPVKIMDNVKVVSLGNYRSAAIKTDGSLWVWPYRGVINPVKIMENVTAVSLGYNHSAAVKTDGSLWTWGNNNDGQLGDGTNIYRDTPVKIMEDVRTVSLGREHSAAIKTDGSLWTWGSDEWGKLGNGSSSANSVNTPVKIMENVRSVRLGYDHSAAIKTDGSLWMWGDNLYGQLGDGTDIVRRSPVKIMENVRSVRLGHTRTIAIKNDGSLWLWGSNNYTAYVGGSYKKTPVLVVENNVIAADLGFSHGAYIHDTGSLWTWGDNSRGQLGDGTNERKTNPVSVAKGVMNNNEPLKITVMLDNMMIEFDQPPVIVDGRTMVPVRAVVEAMNGQVSWDDTTQTVTLTRGSNTINLIINSDVAFLDDKAKKLDVTPQIINGRTLLPIRFVAESFGYDVFWYETDSTVVISSRP